MNRRKLLLSSAALAAAPQIPALAAPAAKKLPMLMKLGTQNNSDPAYLRMIAPLGVTHICSTLPSRKLDEKWSVDSLKRLREGVEAAGIQLAMVPLPLQFQHRRESRVPQPAAGPVARPREGRR
ncbi:MAG: hypothetical protein QM757_31255 [Paludibaculum sp.]